MKELDEIAEKIDRVLSGTPDAPALLALLRQRSRLMKMHAAGNPGLAARLLEQNRRWSEKAEHALAEMKKKIEDEKNSRTRKDSISVAYNGYTQAHKIFSGRG